MANSNGWGDGAANNSIGWGQGANNAIAWGDSHAKSWAGATDIVGIDSDAQAFITAAAITDPVQINAINTLVEGMKTDGIWTKMKAVYPFVGGTASAHKWNLKDPRDLNAAFRLVFNGGWTHSANGATPNGTNGYADTFLIPSSVLAQNSAHISVYSRTDIVSNTVILGAYNVASETSIYPRFTGNLLYAAVNSTTLTSFTSSVNSLGNYIVTRNNSTSENLFKNDVKTSKTINSTGNVSQKLFIGALNFNGPAASYSNRQTAFASIGDGLTDTEAANLYTRVQAFQTALSRQV